MPKNAVNLVKSTLQRGVGSSTGDEAAVSIRRRETRFQCDPASVLLELAGHPEPVRGEIVEVSKTGLQVRMGTSAFATDESVRVSHARMTISGQIRYCQPNDAGAFNAGVQILQVQYAP